MGEFHCRVLTLTLTLTLRIAWENFIAGSISSRNSHTEVSNKNGSWFGRSHRREAAPVPPMLDDSAASNDHALVDNPLEFRNRSELSQALEVF